MDEIQQDVIDVLYVESTNGAEGARIPFDELEKHLAGARAGTFCRICDAATNAYRARVALEPEDEVLDLPRWTIPGGKYARRKLGNWTERIREIGQTFTPMAEAAGRRCDPDRPSIEFYSGHDEVMLLLPLE